jgi:hypothetical protein
MLVFTILACLISDPAQCREVDIGLVSRVATTQQCAVKGMPLAAKWAGEHPKWVVVGYRCAPSSKIERRI